jgi:hypothetical protein
VTWAVQVLDTTLNDPAVPFERHVALWNWTWGATRSGYHELILTVKNLTEV